MALVGLLLSILIAIFGSGHGSMTAAGGTQTKAQDTERTTDIRALQSQAEAYYAVHGDYPTLSNFNSASWRKQNLLGLDDAALQDPNTQSKTLLDAPAKGSYSYHVRGDDNVTCDDVAIECTTYTLSATLSDGQLSSLSSY